MACLINRESCGQRPGETVCSKCGIDTSVMYPSEADLQAALSSAQRKYDKAEKHAHSRQVAQSEPVSRQARRPRELSAEERLEIERRKSREARRQSQTVRIPRSQSANDVNAEEENDASSSEGGGQDPVIYSLLTLAVLFALGLGGYWGWHWWQKRQKSVAAPSTQLEGQAGALQHGRYQISANGTEVKDVLTGLVWARCSVGQYWDGGRCAGEATRVTFYQAQKRSGNGWRVPSRGELFTLVYCSAGRDLKDGMAHFADGCGGQFRRPTIQQDVFPDAAKNSWSSSLDAGNSDSAWSVNFNDGKEYSLYRYSTFPVRLVRASS